MTVLERLVNQKPWSYRLDELGVLCLLTAAVSFCATSARAQDFDEFFMIQTDIEGGEDVAVRRDDCILWDTDFDGGFEGGQCYGLGDQEDEYLIGDWDGDARENVAVRRGSCVYKDFDHDPYHNVVQCFGFGNSEDQYLVGDWDGDGIDNLAVRRDGCILQDVDGDGSHDATHCFGYGDAEEAYLVGDWDGDGIDTVAVRRGDCVLMANDLDGLADETYCSTEPADEFLSGPARYEGETGTIVYRRTGNCITGPNGTQCYGPEVCGTPIDEDGDTVNNEGCVEICSNWVDDDLDGLSDRWDPDCKAPETCNGFDDDHNGAVDDIVACHRVTLIFSDIDDTGRAWFNSDAPGNVVCDVDSGTYPRGGLCDLTAALQSHGSPETARILVRFGNGGGFYSSGTVRLQIDGRDVFRYDAPGQVRGLGWFYEHYLTIDFRRGQLL